MNDFIRLLVGLGFLWIIIGGLTIYVSPSRDSTDPVNGYSGMALYTDSLTGCQYLGHGISGLTPRMNFDGKQIGCKE